MTTATVHLPTLRRRSPALAAVNRERVLLVPCRDGWSLVSSTGEVLVQRLGKGARRACLQYARAAGILAIIS